MSMARRRTSQLSMAIDVNLGTASRTQYARKNFLLRTAQRAGALWLLSVRNLTRRKHGGFQVPSCISRTRHVALLIPFLLTNATITALSPNAWRICKRHIIALPDLAVRGPRRSIPPMQFPKNCLSRSRCASLSDVNVMVSTSLLLV